MSRDTAAAHRAGSRADASRSNASRTDAGRGDGGRADGPSDGRDTYREFTEAVNMKPRELERWLETDESKAVGQHKGGGESVGHDSGRKIVTLLGRKRAELTEADYRHMRKVVGYVRRHMAQRPSGDIRETKWRYSLMNWGHDPLR